MNPGTIFCARRLSDLYVRYFSICCMVLYALGSNGSGQLGNGNKEDVPSPSRCRGLPDESTFSRFAAGGNHTLVLHSSDQVYIAGSVANHSIQEDERNDIEFSLLKYVSDAGKRAKLCSATWEATIIVSTEDTIYTFGIGERGELGRGVDATAALILCPPIDTRCFPKGTTIKDIASGVHHTVVVLSNGDVYGWGNGRKGQLGKPAGIIWEPRKIEGLDFQVTRAVCGREFTYLIGNSHDGHHRIIGTDKWQLKSQSPPSIQGWKDIGASWGSIYVLSESGHIKSWGRNDHGQLAPNGLPTINKIAVGSEHALALSRDGKVLVWGWGEHGNCGSDTDKDGDVKLRWNELAIPGCSGSVTIGGIGAGYATSWLWTTS